MTPQTLSLIRSPLPPAIPARSVPAKLCHDQLTRVASSHTFSKSVQLQRLLTFLGEHSLEPSADALSEKRIASAVLNRRDFDPQTDSLVRKEMCRLREKLARYYSAEGAHDSVIITAPSGYSLDFASVAPHLPKRHKPCLLVLPLRSQSGLAERILEDVLLALAESGTLNLVAPATALAYGQRAGDSREFAAECNADYVVEGSLRRPESSLEVALWLVDGRTGLSERSVRIIKSSLDETVAAIAAWIRESEGIANRLEN